ncbi:MAG: hypothetical protein V1704_04295 [Candidatus Vogelbacteria bacterium]
MEIKNMTLIQASKIVDIYGKHLEFFNGKLLILFNGKIPESFLPFSKKTIEEASNMIAKHHHDNGNQSAVEAIHAGIAGLMMYIDDQEALRQAADFFSSEGWCKAFLPKFKKLQKDNELNF